MLYKGCIGVKKKKRSCPPEGGPAEIGGLSATNLSLIDIPSGTNARRPSQKTREVNYSEAKLHWLEYWKESSWLEENYCHSNSSEIPAYAVGKNLPRINMMMAKINNTQENSMYRLFVYRDKTMNHILNEYSILELSEYRSKPVWFEKWYIGNCARK